MAGSGWLGYEIHMSCFSATAVGKCCPHSRKQPASKGFPAPLPPPPPPADDLPAGLLCRWGWIGKGLVKDDLKTPVEGLVSRVDYRGVNPTVWFLYLEMYGKDSAQELCRRVAAACLLVSFFLVSWGLGLFLRSHPPGYKAPPSDLSCCGPVCLMFSGADT